MVPFYLKHYPLKPFKLTNQAYVGHLSGNNHFRNFPILFIDTMCGIECNVGLKFEANIPKHLWSVRLNELLNKTVLYLSFGCIQPWGKWLCLFLSDMMTFWVFCLTGQGPFLWHCHIMLKVAPHPAEREGTEFHGLHISWAWLTNVCGKHCAQLLIFLDTVVVNNKSLYMLSVHLLYSN